MKVRAIHLFKQLIHLRYIIITVLCCLLLCACANQDVSYNPSDWENNIANCYPCTLYNEAFSALDKAIVSLTKYMANNAMIILGFGLLFWMLFKVGTFIVSVHQPNTKRFVQSVLVTFFKAILVASLLFNPTEYVTFIGQNIVQPVFLIIADFSRQILLASQDVSSHLITKDDFIVGSVSSESNLLFGETKDYIADIIYRITTGLRSGQALAMTLMRSPGFTSYLFGLLTLFIFFCLLIKFPVMFIDSFIRVGAVIILSPFMFVAWVFPATKSVIKKGWNVLFGAMINILFGCIFISLMVYVLYTYIERTYSTFFDTACQSADPALVLGIKTFRSSIISIFVLVLAMNKLSGYIPTLASKFGGDGSGGSLSQQFGSLINLGKNIVKLGINSAIALATQNPRGVIDSLKKIKDDMANIAKGNEKGNGG